MEQVNQGHLYGKFREAPISDTINLAHLKRIRNKSGEIAMLIGTPEMCETLEFMDEAFEIEVPSKMIY